MNHLEGIITIKSLIPATIGGTLCILTLIGIKEFLKETLVAFKKSSHA